MFLVLSIVHLIFCDSVLKGRVIGVCEPENEGFVLSSYKIGKGMNMTSSAIQPISGDYFGSFTPLALDGKGSAFFTISRFSSLMGFQDQSLFSYVYRDEKDYFQPKQASQCSFTEQEEFIIRDLQYSKNIDMLVGLSFDRQNLTSIFAVNPRTCQIQMLYSGFLEGLHFPTDGSFGGIYETKSESKYLFLHDSLKQDLSEVIVLDLKKLTISRHVRKDYDKLYIYRGGSISCVTETCYINVFRIPYYDEAKEEIYSMSMKDETLEFLKIDETLHTRNPELTSFFVDPVTKNIGRVLGDDYMKSFVTFDGGFEKKLSSYDFEGLNAPYQNYAYDPFVEG